MSGYVQFQETLNPFNNFNLTILVQKSVTKLCFYDILAHHFYRQLIFLLTFSPISSSSIATLRDDTPPVVIGCTQPVSYQLPFGDTTLQISWVEPRAIDNSGVTPRKIQSHQPGESFPAGTTQISYTFFDDAGNSAACTFSITVCKYVNF